MYSNAGRSIKKYVEIIVKIGYALSIIPAVIILILGFSAENFGIALLGIVIAVVVGGLGCLSSWFFGLWTYAYGEIADRLISIEETLTNSSVPVPSPISTVTPVSSTSVPAHATPAPSGTGWTCSCGRVHAPYVSTCPCGINKRDLHK